MGLATRIIPTLLFRGEELVKGKHFDPWRSVGLVEQAARIYAHRAVDEVLLLDVQATPQEKGPDFALISRIARDFYTPLTVGGGVRSVNDVRRLLASGADKVCLGTEAMLNPTFVTECAMKFGSQAIAVAVDVKNDMCWWRCGSMTDGCRPIFQVKRYEQQGAGEIILTSIDREGTMKGYDLDLIRDVACVVGIPVVAHGGCSDYSDMYEAIHAGAHAVAAGALFQFTDATPKGAAQYLAGRGIEVRHL